MRTGNYAAMATSSPSNADGLFRAGQVRRVEPLVDSMEVVAARGFRVVPLPLGRPDGFARFLFMREHVDKSGVTQGRTLFVTNVGDDGAAALEAVFSTCGEIEAIELLRGGGDEAGASIRQTSVGDGEGEDGEYGDDDAAAAWDSMRDVLHNMMGFTQLAKPNFKARSAAAARPGRSSRARAIRPRRCRTRRTRRSRRSARSAAKPAKSSGSAGRRSSAPSRARSGRRAERPSPSPRARPTHGSRLLRR